MKIILSRKGFDSTAGGYPSPIIDNKIISLPIPDEKDSIKYSDLIFTKNKSYFDLMKELGIKNINKDTKCHLDPDLEASTIKCRGKDWRPLLGQIEASQSHLENQGVSVGDLFLFFGWFRKTRINAKNQLEYFGPDFHMIFGYLRIGEIIKTKNNKNIEKWLNYHSHIKRTEWLNKKTNTLYIASNKKQFEGINEGKILKFNNNLILTKNGHPRSHWSLPDFFRETKISYHPNAWREEYFQSAGRGQEFVITSQNKEETNKLLKKWVNKKLY